jgi:hypothetical protein
MGSTFDRYQQPHDGNVLGKALAGFGAAFLVSQATNSLPDIEFLKVNKTSFLRTSYMPLNNSSTYNSFTSINGDYILSSLNFEQATTNFYSKLFASQEVLGEDFERILNENLWDLYES